MARMKRGAKTQAVRDYIAENPEANPKAIVEGLKEKGMTVKIGLVNSVKYNRRSKTKKRRSPSVHSAARRTKSTGVTVGQLIEIKRFADSLGGIEGLRQALELLEQLR